MKTFYLMREKSGRLFIDEVEHDECEVIETIEARTWLEARAKFAGV